MRRPPPSAVPRLEVVSAAQLALALEEFLYVPELSRIELVVKNHGVYILLIDKTSDLFELSAADKGLGVGIF